RDLPDGERSDFNGAGRRNGPRQPAAFTRRSRYGLRDLVRLVLLLFCPGNIRGARPALMLSARAADLKDILHWREMYRSEMDCQIIHDSTHGRPGWTVEYVLFAGGAGVGYGSVAVGGPWKRAPTAYEFYVVPDQRSHLFGLFEAFLATSRARFIEAQSNDLLTSPMLLTFATRVRSQAILFHDKLQTALRPHGATFRAPVENELEG